MIHLLELARSCSSCARIRDSSAIDKLVLTSARTPGRPGEPATPPALLRSASLWGLWIFFACGYYASRRESLTRRWATPTSFRMRWNIRENCTRRLGKRARSERADVHACVRVCVPGRDRGTRFSERSRAALRISPSDPNPLLIRRRVANPVLRYMVSPKEATLRNNVT